MLWKVGAQAGARRQRSIGVGIMAAACGILIVVLGILSAGGAPSEMQALTELTCLVAGLILCFLAVVLSRLKALAVRLDAFEAVGAAPPEGEAESEAEAEVRRETAEPAERVELR